METASKRTTEADGIAEQCTALLARYAETGDREGFDELAHLAQPFLRRRASVELARCGLNIDESEVVQEALLNLFRYAHTFRPEVPYAFSTWAARVVRNVVLRYLRRRRQAPIVSIDEIEGVDLPDRKAKEPFLRLLESESCQQIRTSFSLYLRVYFGAYLGLTDLQRQVLHRVEILGRSYREIADELSMRVEAVKMVVYRARKRLAAEMARAAAG